MTKSEYAEKLKMCLRVRGDASLKSRDRTCHLTSVTLQSLHAFSLRLPG